MLIGYFDLYCLFAVGIGWSAALSSRDGASKWASRWPWIVGAVFGTCILGSGMGITSAMDMRPPTVGEEPGVAGFDLMLWGLYGAQISLGFGYLWLIALTATYFLGPRTEAEEGPS